MAEESARISHTKFQSNQRIVLGGTLNVTKKEPSTMEYCLATSETKKDVAEYGIFTATKIAVAAAIGFFAPQIPPDQRRSLKQVHKSFIITINVGRKISATENLHFGIQIKTNTVRKQERINGRMFRKCIQCLENAYLRISHGLCGRI
jgi:hypothetical protein